MESMSEYLREYIRKAEWRYAKTYADTWPHEYLVRAGMPDKAYRELCSLVDEGRKEYFFRKEQKYLHADGFSYWVMATPNWKLDAAGIVNRTYTELYFGMRTAAGLYPATPEWKRIAPTLHMTHANGREGWVPDIARRVKEMYAAGVEVKAPEGKTCQSDALASGKQSVMIQPELF